MNRKDLVDFEIPESLEYTLKNTYLKNQLITFAPEIKSGKILCSIISKNLF